MSYRRLHTLIPEDTIDESEITKAKFLDLEIS